MKEWTWDGTRWASLGTRNEVSYSRIYWWQFLFKQVVAGLTIWTYELGEQGSAGLTCLSLIWDLRDPMSNLQLHTATTDSLKRLFTGEMGNQWKLNPCLLSWNISFRLNSVRAILCYWSRILTWYAPNEPRRKGVSRSGNDRRSEESQL